MSINKWMNELMNRSVNESATSRLLLIRLDTWHITIHSHNSITRSSVAPESPYRRFITGIRSRPEPSASCPCGEGPRASFSPGQSARDHPRRAPLPLPLLLATDHFGFAGRQWLPRLLLQCLAHLCSTSAVLRASANIHEPVSSTSNWTKVERVSSASAGRCRPRRPLDQEVERCQRFLVGWVYRYIKT